VVFLGVLLLDLSTRYDEELILHQARIEQCKHDYIRSRCDSPRKAPVVVNHCLELEACISRDIEKVSITRLVQGLVIDLINDLTGRLSYASLGTVCLFGLW
jgi:hypothetical protein